MDRFIFNLTKLLLYVMSVLTVVLAVTILVLSVLTGQRTTMSNRQNYAPQQSDFINDFYFLIAVSIGGSLATVCVSLYGMTAIYRESILFVGVHAILLLLIHSGSLLIGSAIFFDEQQIGEPASLFFKVSNICLHEAIRTIHVLLFSLCRLTTTMHYPCTSVIPGRMARKRSTRHSMVFMHVCSAVVLLAHRISLG